MADFLSRERGVVSGGMHAGMGAIRLIRKMQRAVFRGVAGDFDPVARGWEMARGGWGGRAALRSGTAASQAESRCSAIHGSASSVDHVSPCGDEISARLMIAQ